nr:peptidoglycan recognition family protein [uncultured Blautia sp.]
MTDKSPKPSFPRRPDLHKEKRTIPGKRQRIRQRNRRLILACGLLVLIIVCIILLIGRKHAADQAEETASQSVSGEETSSDGPQQWQEQGAPYIDVQLLTPNEYSRPQLPITQVNYIAIHYTANPGASAQANRDYFENLSWTHETKVSSHFVVGLEGEVIQCIPSSEMSYATNSRNVDTLSIECCHPDESGKFNDATYESVVKLAAWLCVRFGLDQEAVIRHYDVTGKECPKYYVDYPQAWEQMKADIQARIQEDEALQ